MLVCSEKNSILVILKKEDKLIEKLTDIVTKNKIKGGYISGIGALKNVELGYYELDNKEFLHKTFSDTNYELLSLIGNVSLRDDKPFVHAHVTLGKRDFSTFGGHLFEATVAVTAEITIFPLGKMPCRKMNSQIGLPLICDYS